MPVSASVTGLQPNQGYELRLVAVNADGSHTSSVAGFTTVSAAPEVLTLAGKTEGSVTWLKGKVNPNNQPTRFWIEYGKTTNYDARLPVAGTDEVGSGYGDVSVAETIRDLTPGTYHFRVLAENATGQAAGADAVLVVAQADACPNAAIRRAQDAERLPDCRAYERVTPSDKSGGIPAYPFLTQGHSAGVFAMAGLSTDGTIAVYPSFQAFADAPSGLINTYRAKRTAGGWVTNTWSPAPELRGRRGVPPMLVDRTQMFDATDDMKTGFMLTAFQFDPLSQRPYVPAYSNPYDLYRVDDQRVPDWQTRPNSSSPVTTSASHVTYAGRSADGSHAILHHR